MADQTDPELDLARAIVTACEQKGSGPTRGLQLADTLADLIEPMAELVAANGPAGAPMIRRAVGYALQRAMDRRDDEVRADVARSKAKSANDGETSKGRDVVDDTARVLDEDARDAFAEGVKKDAF